MFHCCVQYLLSTDSMVVIYASVVYSTFWFFVCSPMENTFVGSLPTAPHVLGCMLLLYMFNNLENENLRNVKSTAAYMCRWFLNLHFQSHQARTTTTYIPKHEKQCAQQCSIKPYLICILNSTCTTSTNTYTTQHMIHIMSH